MDVEVELRERTLQALHLFYILYNTIGFIIIDTLSVITYVLERLNFLCLTMHGEKDYGYHLKKKFVLPQAAYTLSSNTNYSDASTNNKYYMHDPNDILFQ